MSAIRIEALKKSFGRFRALDGLSLTVEAGTVFGFLGPNGAGKTTTLRILTGLAHADSGGAWVDGLEVGKSAEIPSRIGYLPEEPAFYPWMTGIETLETMGQIHRIEKAERRRRVDELLEMAGLTEAGKRRVGGYSRGMRQRLGLAQALIHRPQVLLLDEPASALDPAGRKDVLGMIEGLRGQCAVFMSTHILADVERICDTVAIIDRGKLVVNARREDLIARYAIPMLALEAEDGDRLNQLAAEVRQMEWARAVVVKGKRLTVTVNDLAAAQRALLARAVAVGLVVTHYEQVKPSLEDVFLRIVENGKGSRQL
ncbi:MAG: ABC transporter ATP-binding protein [Bellilinea sp.]